MKQIILPFILLCLVHSSFAQSADTLKAWFYRGFDLAKEYSLYSNEVNWDSLETELDPVVQKIQDLNDLKIPLTQIINELKDHHGRFLYQFQPWAYMTDSHSRQKDKRPNDMAKWRAVNYENGGHQTEMLAEEIGYIKVVGVGPQEDIEAVAAQIRNGIANLAEQGAQKWVLDLRYNGGGNMFPMLEGLAPLLGEGAIGGAKMGSGERVAWQIQNGHFCRGGQCPIDLPPNPEISSDSEVAVLLSRYTVSSGEVVATCFKGRKNTLFIGEASGGYVTETNWAPIGENLVMSIAVSRYMDRWGNVYYENIPVDEEVEFEIVDDFEKDEGIQAALRWLKTKK